ncbi:MAG TPA: SRPBCC domain-containing protein [Cytophagaceae bacterium]|jgi:uncharacterized glyoxalase superfamily protein PhnB/uncharacterized protein YndB with AHSA1/START domain|nr:SRPBCC domain-containing protein [Cytophagaceae bacterium]
MANNKTEILKDLPNKKLNITRHFDAPLEDVWRAWTESELLDLWWAPQPWKAETKTMNFKEGGSWLYAMVGPDHARHWAKVDFKKIDLHKSFEVMNYFCDEKGKIFSDFPTMNWKNTFSSTANGTKVLVDISFTKEEDIQQIIEMGFEAGFTAALGNLDQYFAAKFKLRNELKTGISRVVTYLNFPGNTEDAFLFYQSVFGTEFSGKGLQRFGDIPSEAGHPPVADNVKNMILHVELPILGGHILMATDAPKEMGFSLVQGNNMHICLEPSTKADTKKLFEKLSQGGNITMPLEDMFFGSYFGSCVDRFGINWMFNCNEKK